jgi:septum site-determining protein MinC
MSQKITMKGTPQGLLLQPQSTQWVEILTTLEASLKNAGGFFRGGRVILQLQENTTLETEVFGQLRALLEAHDLQLWAVMGGTTETQRLVRSHGIRTQLPPSSSKEEEGPQARFIQRTVRSGQRVTFSGHLTLLGDVNPGGEIIAGGNIIVWGRVQGVVHAGAFGDTNAVICALDLNPAQLRIANLIARSPENSTTHPAQPERAHIQDNVIIVEPWKGRGL